MMKRILVVGDGMLDQYHFGDVNRISPEAPVPVFLQSGNSNSAGGAANVAVNIASIGIPVDLCCAIGEDEAGTSLMRVVEKYRIGTRLMRVCPDRRTTCKSRYIAQNNQQILRADLEDAEEIPFVKVSDLFRAVEDSIDLYGLVLLSDYAKGFLTVELTERLIELCHHHNMPVFADVKGKEAKKYYGATLIKPNRKELQDLSGLPARTTEEAGMAAQSLCNEAGAGYVLTTLGADGMLLADAKGVLKVVRSIAREVYDVTGAGDTTIAYLSAAFLTGNPITKAMEVANAAAGIQVGKVGTGIVKPEEVRAAMQRGRSAKKIVFTNGCFDILHAGHVAYLKKAKTFGDWLVVGINSDDSVRRIKGESRPVNSLDDRKMVLESLSFIDEVIPFDEDTPLELIKQVHPDVLVKGGDYKLSDIVGADEVQAYGGEVKVLDYIQGKSTTEIIKKMKEKG